MLTAAYQVYQCHVSYIYSKKCKGDVMIKMMRGMQLISLLMVVPIAVQFINYNEGSRESNVIEYDYILSESILYLLKILQSLLFYQFLFKFNQVELELLMMQDGIPTKKIVRRLNRFKMRTKITFAFIILLSIIFVVSYLICELQEIRIFGMQNTYTLVSKTIQLVLQTPINIYFIYLFVKFALLGMRITKIMNDDVYSVPVNLICALLGFIFSLNNMVDMFLYIYPYVQLYAEKGECWPVYPTV